MKRVLIDVTACYLTALRAHGTLDEQVGALVQMPVDVADLHDFRAREVGASRRQLADETPDRYVGPQFTQDRVLA